jgi:hypothetical protein
LAPDPVHAQYLTRPHIPWRTITTARFAIHFPAEMEEWTRLVADQMETVADAVNAIVGNAPSSRITIIVEDPSNVANGFALPFLEAPVIFLWPTPPAPSPTFGSHRGWGEALAVHEYAHIAHLTFPSRSPSERRFWRFMPVRVSPVVRKAPAWVIEGYATLIEGQLTGSGRPFSAGRAAVLRQWALEGRFPTYAQLNGTNAFLGGNMRYLIGSAFLEWLQERRGDSSLVHLWRRMSARQNRSFEDAFAGVFGVGPTDLYGAFTVDVMDRALQVRTRLREATVVRGELVQRLTGATGEPALSPDGSRLALVLRSLSGPSRLVVIPTRTAPDSALQRARAELLRRDSLDVLPVDSLPRPRRPLATLHPFHGRSHEQPRWMPDGIHVLVSRDEPATGGITRPDLFSWNTRTGSVRRVTRGASVRQADPSPDGRDAVGVRCHAGTCSVVRIDVETGAWQVLVPGNPRIVWHRPRYSPDGTRLAASVQADGQWHVALIDAATGSVRRLTTDPGVSRYAPVFTPDGSALIAVSDRGGIPNLELIPLNDDAPPRPITRVTGAVAGPDVNRADGSAWFLSLRTGGYDLHRLASEDFDVGQVVSIAGVLAPVAPPTAPQAGLLDTAGRQSVPVDTYGLGPRRWRVLPGGTGGPDGETTTLMVGNIDPIGRLSVLAQGTFGSRGTWRGGTIAAAWRGWPVIIEGAAWHVQHEPSLSEDHLAPTTSDIEFTGVGLQARLNRQAGSASWLVRGIASTGATANTLVDGNRYALGVEARGGWAATLRRINLGVAAGVLADAGTTGGDRWSRTIASATFAIGMTRRGLRADWLLGRVTTPPAGGFGVAQEQFVLGGAGNPLVDPAFMAQRLPLPSVPAGFLSGSAIQLFRATMTGNAWEPYFVWVNDGAGFEGLRRIAGIEQTFGIQSLGFVRLPGIRARVGASYSFDAPFASRPRAYLSLTFVP